MVFVELTFLSQLFRYPEQTSQPVNLVKGKVYYMEGRVKEGGAGDHLSVGVKLPSGIEEKPLVNNIYMKPPGMILKVFFGTVMPNYSKVHFIAPRII